MKFAKQLKKEVVLPVMFPKYHKHSAACKQRAFELYMMLDEITLERRYSQAKIAAILSEEFKDEPGFLPEKVTTSLLSYWVSEYGWLGYFNASLAKAKELANAEVKQSAAYKAITAGAKANTTNVDILKKELDRKQALMQQVDRVAPIASTIIVDLFMLNQEHFKKLMLKKSGTNDWEYDCDRNSRRKQLFDMWMTGTTKMLELYNMTPPKKTSTKATVTSNGNTQEIDIDSTTGGGVPLTDPNYELILKLFGMEQVKGGFGNELAGPNNADFPSTAGSKETVTASEDGSHT